MQFSVLKDMERRIIFSQISSSPPGAGFHKLAAALRIVVQDYGIKVSRTQVNWAVQERERNANTMA